MSQSATGSTGFCSRFCVIFVVSVVSLCGEIVSEDLVKGLSSDDFKTREFSQSKLTEWAAGDPSRIGEISKILGVTDDPEVQMRSLAILKALSDQDYLKSGKGYLGIQMGEEVVPKADGGAEFVGIRVGFVVKGTPAEAAGIRRGDLILSLDGMQWKETGAMQQFMARIADAKPLQVVVLKVRRGEGEELEIPVRLGRRPVDDLNFGYGEDVELLDRKARDKHFKKWLKEQGLDVPL